MALIVLLTVPAAGAAVSTELVQVLLLKIPRDEADSLSVSWTVGVNVLPGEVVRTERELGVGAAVSQVKFKVLLAEFPAASLAVILSTVVPSVFDDTVVVTVLGLEKLTTPAPEDLTHAKVVAPVTSAVME